MRELQISEINEVAGAGFFGSLAGGVLVAIGGFSQGMMKGGVAAGSTGGILGIGGPSALVGAAIGGVTGVIQGFTYGVVNGWDKSLKLFNDNAEQWADWTIVPKV